MAERSRRNWRAPFGPVLSVVLAAGTGIIPSGSEPQNASASTISRVDPCTQLPPIDALGHPSAQIKNDALACWQIEKGKNGRKITIVTVKKPPEYLQFNTKYMLEQSSHGLLSPDIVVQQASPADQRIIQQIVPISCTTPAEATPAAIEANKVDKNNRGFVVVDLAAIAKNCDGAAYDKFGIADVFPFNPKDINPVSLGSANATNPHEIGHLFNISHAGVLENNIHSPTNLEDFINHATYKEYSDPTNIMGSYNENENMTFNPVQLAILNEPAVLLNKAAPDALRLGAQWTSINSKKASLGVFGIAHLDKPFTKKGQDTASGHADFVTFDSLVFIPQKDINGTIASVMIMAFDRTKSNKTAVIGTVPVSSAMTTMTYENQAFQIQRNGDELRLRTVPRDKTGGLQAFLKPSSFPTQFPKAVMHAVH